MTFYRSEQQNGYISQTTAQDVFICERNLSVTTYPKFVPNGIPTRTVVAKVSMAFRSPDVQPVHSASRNYQHNPKLAETSWRTRTRIALSRNM